MRGLVDAYDSGLVEPLSSIERAALALTLVRQPLWSTGGWVAHLDDQEYARRHAMGVVSAVDWGLALVRELDRWQRAFISLLLRERSTATSC